jgi:hypothetical protein
VQVAWDAGDYDQVPTLCDRALAHGGLARADVLEAYTRMGAAWAILGKKWTAVAAFRKAALIDPAFALPPEAGKRASAYAALARRDQKRLGALALSLAAPQSVDAGGRFGVDVSLSMVGDSPVATLTFDVTDTLAGKTYEKRETAAPQVHFEVPTRMTLPEASLLLRVHARDSQDNELAEAEQRVHVEAAPPVRVPGPVAALTTTAPKEDRERKSSGGFWSSAWPYVIGGAALAAGGTTAWFLTRPTDNVDVGSVRVQLVH